MLRRKMLMLAFLVSLFALALHSAITNARNETERLHPSKLDFVAFDLDDGVAAGDAAAVSYLAACFARAAASLGLTTSASNCVFVPSAGPVFAFNRGLFEGCTWKVDEGFKLLGCPFGTDSYCLQHTEKRMRKAVRILDKISTYGHTQGALLLLRHCASWGKLVYSMRIVPPDAHRTALAHFGKALRTELEHMLGEAIPDRAWLLAQLGLTHGGLGIRDPCAHAPAAYLASLASTPDLRCWPRSLIHI